MGCAVTGSIRFVLDHFIVQLADLRTRYLQNFASPTRQSVEAP
jgi:hypothetical protein